MSKEVQPKKTRSTKKVTEGSNTADLEAKIAELEAKLANLSSQVTPSEVRPAKTIAPPPKPQPRPAASGPTHGTLPAGMKPAESKPEPKPQPRPAASGPTHGTLPAGFKPVEAPKPEPTTGVQPTGEVAPAYAKISSTGYTGNKYFATRKRLSYHPADKQFTGSSTTSTASTTTTTAPPPSPEPESQTSTLRGTLPAGMKPQEKKSLWKAKGAEVAESYDGQEEHKSSPPPKPQPRPAASGPTHGTLPAGMKPAESKPEPKPQPRPAASGPTHGTLPAGFKPVEAPKPEPQPEPTTGVQPTGEVAPAYAKISSTGYTGNKYFATRKRLSYHPADKQFTGSSSRIAQEVPAPKPKSTIRGTLPAGFKH